MEYRIYSGPKATLNNGQISFDFECDADDIDNAYSILAHIIHLNNQDPNSQDLIDFEWLDDDNVEAMLKDAVKHGFISDYKIINYATNDLEKAQSLLSSKTVTLKYISEHTEIPYPTLRTYVSNLDKMKNAGWENMRKLAKLYDRLNKED